MLLCLLAPLNSNANENTAFFRMLLDYANIANASYKDNNSIKQTLQQQGYQLTQYNRLPGYGVTYLIATDTINKRQVVAIRGTSNVENTIVDASFVMVKDEKTGIDLHQGFALSARDIYEKIKTRLHKNYRISTTGHSLGGAVAVIIAMYLDTDGYKVDKVVTFGQPKVTNIAGSRKYGHLKLYRVVNPKDMVPLVPPADPMDMMKLSIFWHMGTEILLLPGKQYAELSGLKSMMRAVEFLDDQPSQQHISDHFMSSYLQNLEQKLPDPVLTPYEIELNFSDWLKTGAD